MPIAINGSGTVTGISVGGLPDGIVDTDMIAANSVTAPKRGAGAILQVVTASTTTEVSTSSASFIDTNLQASITPSSSSNKILVLIDAPFHVIRNPGTSNSFHIKVLRDSTEITDAITDGGTHLSGIGSGAISSNSSAGSINKIVLDSPSSTSSLTYKLQFGQGFSNNTIFFQDGSQSHITLMEVKG